MFAIILHGRKKYHLWGGVKGSSLLNKIPSICHVKLTVMIPSGGCWVILSPTRNLTMSCGQENTS